MRRLAAAAAATALLVLAGCGDDGEEIDADAEQDRNDAAIEALVESLEDDGFAFDQAADDEEQEFDFDSEDCERFADAFDAAEDLAIAEAESDRFASGGLETGGETTVEGDTASIEDEGDAAEVFELYGDDDLGECVLEAFQTSLDENAEESGVDASDVEFDELDAPDVGEEAFAFSISGEFSLEDLSFPFQSEISFARDGRHVVSITITEVGDDAPGADAEDLLDAMLDELVAE